MKLCRRCNETKPEASFNFKYRDAGKLQSYCKVCSRIYVKEHYYANKTYYLQKARKRNKVIRKYLQEYVLNYLNTHPCVDCGEKDPVVLEFDHIRDKLIAVSELFKYSLKKMESEIKKCEVRCSNCHRRKTAIQFNWYKRLPL